MFEEAKDIDALTDDQVLEFIADLPRWELNLVQRMLIQAEVHNIPMRRRACEIILRTSPSADGRRAKQIVEAMKAVKEREIDLDQLAGMGDRSERKEKGGSSRSIFSPSRWSIGGGDR